MVRGDRRTFDTRRPTGTDVGVRVEVADSSLRFDRVIKLPPSAAANIPVDWIVNLIGGHIEVSTDPAPQAYRTRTDDAPGQHMPLAFDGTAVVAIPVADLWP